MERENIKKSTIENVIKNISGIENFRILSIADEVPYPVTVMDVASAFEYIRNNNWVSKFFQLNNSPVTIRSSFQKTIPFPGGKLRIVPEIILELKYIFGATPSVYGSMNSSYDNEKHEILDFVYLPIKTN